MRILGVVVLIGVFVVGTWLAGWMTVPAIALAYAITRRDVRAPREAGLAALLAWLILLLRLTPDPAFRTLLNQLGQIFPMPGIAVAALTVVLATVLAWSAARVVIGIVGVRTPV